MSLSRPVLPPLGRANNPGQDQAAQANVCTGRVAVAELCAAGAVETSTSRMLNGLLLQ